MTPNGQLGASLSTAELICKGSPSTTHGCGKGLPVPAVRRLQPRVDDGRGQDLAGSTPMSGGPSPGSSPGGVH